MKIDAVKSAETARPETLQTTEGATPPAITSTSAAPRASMMLAPPLVRVLVPAFCALVAFATYQTTAHLSEGRVIAAWIATAVFLVAFPFAARFRGLAQAGDAVNAAVVLVIGLSGLALQLAAPQAASFAVVLTAIVVAGFRLSDAVGRLVAVVLAGIFLVFVVRTEHIGGAEVVSICMGLIFGYVAAASVRSLRLEQIKTEALLKEVLAGREAQVRAAKLDERAHVAREMHDVLAHTLSALSIQLEGARMLVEQRPTDPAALQAVERSSTLAKEGLNEARRAVGSLRGDEAPDLEDLPRLVEDFERDTGVQSRFRVEGSGSDLAPEVRLALYRVVQEGLTNVRKHAEAHRVDVLLRYGPESAEVVIEDEGAAKPSLVEGGGYGLRGMRERAALIGGELEAGPTPTGFRVRLCVPT